MTAISAVTPKISKLLPLLASDKPGEVVATAAAITRTLKQAGADWHDLAAAISFTGQRGLSPSERATTPMTWADIPPSERRAVLDRVANSDRLSPWEASFIGSIQQQVRGSKPLSPKQVEVINRIILKIVWEVRA